MTWSLAATAVLMGLAGGPHCIAMCGAACAGIGQAGAPRGTLAIGWFQVGRLTGYTLLGALAAASMQGLVTLGDTGIQVTPMGWFFVRGVAMVFDKYLQADRTRARFSKII